MEWVRNKTKKKKNTDCISPPNLNYSQGNCLACWFFFIFSLWLPYSFSNVVHRESTAVRYSPHLIFGHCQWFIICVSSSPFFGCSCRCFFLSLPFPHSFSMKGDDMLFAQRKREKKSRENFMQNARRKWAAENFFIARPIGNGGERGSSSKHIIHSVQLTTCGRGFLKHYWATFMY